MTWSGTPDLSLVDLLVVILGRTRAEAMTIDRLAHECHASRRAVETALQEMADGGQWPVVASSSPPRGVWMGSEADVAEYLARHDARIRTMLQRRHGLRRWLAARTAQPLTLPWAGEEAA